MSQPRRFRRTLTERASAAGDEARERALDAAILLFAEHGYRGTSITQVADAAALSHSGLLYHFPSKQALLTAVLDTVDERVALRRPLGELPLGWSAFEYALLRPIDPKLSRFLVAIAAESIDPAHPAHAWVVGMHESLESWLTAAVRSGIETGEFRVGAPVDLIVLEAVSAYLGIELVAAVRGSAPTRQRSLERLLGDLRARWDPAQAA